MKHLYAYPEAELIAGCKRSKNHYQQALYQQHHRKMFGVCLRYTDNRQDAEDVLQDGFIKVFKNIKSFKGKGSLEGWIRRIMVNTAIEHYRKRSRYFMVEIDSAYELELPAEQLEALGRGEILDLVQALPAGYRTVFNLYAIEGYSHKEIAEMMGISVGTSKSQFSRAKALLREQMQRREVG
jgi:RNA polymerase sigma factor (sigma-70 family)